MKKVNFIGAYDKTDCILYVAKILTVMGKKVLVVDSTTNQKARYIVPVISPTISYVTEFENIDVAVGFENFNKIKNYLGISDESELDYDYTLIDIDSATGLNGFKAEPTENNYFVTGFDVYSLKKGLEAFNTLKEQFNMTKVLFSKEMLKEEDDYLNFLSAGLKVVWKEYRVYFPVENGDATVIAENQRLAKIKFKNLSAQYKESLLYIAEDILKDANSSELRRAMRMIERDKGV